MNDKKAAEIVEKIDYDFNSLKISEKTNIMMCIRAKLIDNYVKRFFSENKSNVALHLGCGLDSRYHRIKNDNVGWYDLDFEEVINIRQYFFEEIDNYHMIASSVTEPEWIDEIPQGKDNLYYYCGRLIYVSRRKRNKRVVKSIKR